MARRAARGPPGAGNKFGDGPKDGRRWLSWLPSACARSRLHRGLRRGRQQHAVDDVRDAVARLDVRRHDRDAIHKDAIAVDLEAQLEAGKRFDAEAVREVRRKHLARNDVVQQDGLEVLRREQLLGRDAQFADQGQKVLILGGEDTGVGLGSELRQF